MLQMEHQLGQVRSVLMRMIEGAMEREGSLSLSEAKTLGASDNAPEDQGGAMDNVDIGASTGESTRRDSLMPQEGGLIVEMEREAMEAGLGGWFNRNPEDVLESWSGSNSDASASQDRVRTTLLTTIGSQTLPNLVRVPYNLVHPGVLRSLMEGPIRPWQCLVWSEMDPPEYTQDPLPVHTDSGPSHVLLQVSPYYEDINGEYSGLVIDEEIEGNEGGDASVE